jgi:parallel beta-helix repeat protein
VVDVKGADFGARGDGRTDDTASIQRAIDAVAGSGGTVRIPDGTYLINALAKDGRDGLRLGSRMTLSLAPGAILKAIPNAVPGCSILAAREVQDVTILGGTLQGDRDGHLGTEGEWGMGLTISRSNRIAVQDLTARDCWGDGFYVASASTGITFCGVTGDRNRRQGLSIVGASHMVVRGCRFTNTFGTAPECGIDVEPNSGETVQDLEIVDCELTNNRGGGFAGGPKATLASSAFFTNSRIHHNRIAGNGLYGIAISSCRGNSFQDNLVTGTQGVGMLLRTNALDMTVRGNTITGSTKDGMELEDCTGTVITGNRIKGNGGKAIRKTWNCGARIEGNAL